MLGGQIVTLRRSYMDILHEYMDILHTSYNLQDQRRRQNKKNKKFYSNTFFERILLDNDVQSEIGVAPLGQFAF